MTAVLYVFWDGFAATAEADTVDSTPCWVAGMVNASGILSGGAFIPGMQRGQAYKLVGFKGVKVCDD